MLTFLATTENQKLIIPEDSRCNCVKVDRNHWSKTAIRIFSRIFSMSRADLFSAEFRKKCNRREKERERERERERDRDW